MKNFCLSLLCLIFISGCINEKRQIKSPISLIELEEITDQKITNLQEITSIGDIHLWNNDTLFSFNIISQEIKKKYYYFDYEEYKKELIKKFIDDSIKYIDKGSKLDKTWDIGEFEIFNLKELRKGEYIGHIKVNLSTTSENVPAYATNYDLLYISNNEIQPLLEWQIHDQNQESYNTLCNYYHLFENNKLRYFVTKNLWSDSIKACFVEYDLKQKNKKEIFCYKCRYGDKKIDSLNNYVANIKTYEYHNEIYYTENEKVCKIENNKRIEVLDLNKLNKDAIHYISGIAITNAKIYLQTAVKPMKPENSEFLENYPIYYYDLKNKTLNLINQINKNACIKTIIDNKLIIINEKEEEILVETINL